MRVMLKKLFLQGGCFWCMEADFEYYQKMHSGIISVVSGYDGGRLENPNYEVVSSGKTNYKEVVEVTYDLGKISYASLLKFLFMHVDPTVENQQFCHKGKQYASAVY